MDQAAIFQRGVRLCDGVLEWGWLATVIAAPAYFNTADVRAFEPDKAILVRDLAAILWDCGSGRELRAGGFAADVRHAAQLDCYDSVPLMQQGRLEAGHIA